ncbi:MAG: ABC transporter ATP-binding protein [Lentisphaeria bacterium]|nr:ABC transporter ATP-binding protein [Lentisphaeria bacterium]
MNDGLILEMSGISKNYRLGNNTIEVIKEINWQVHRGEWAVIVGASGSGKTTLLNMAGLLERPDRGTIRAVGYDYARFSAREAARFRNRKIGFVFQSYCLLPELNVLENTVLPALMAGTSRREAEKKARQWLDRLGLSGRLKHRAPELSGGEQQRAAIARALINDPDLLLTDEPTGNLDLHTGEEILALFRDLRDNDPDRAIIMITHNPEIARSADSAYELFDGRLRPLGA